MFKYISFLYLLSALSAQPCKTDIQIKNSIDIKAKNIKNQIHKFIKIENYEQLFTELNIKPTISILKDKRAQKLLEDSNINNYTVTYLVYDKIINFKKVVANHVSEYGGEFIGLIHIKTLSQSDYKRSKKIKPTWSNILKLSKRHTVRVKNIILSNKIIYPADNIKQLMRNREIFLTTSQRSEKRITLNSENDLNNSSITPQLKILQIQNNLNFIRKNKNQFLEDLNCTNLIYFNYNPLTIIKKRVKQKADKVTYPKRYERNIKEINTKIEKLTLHTKQIAKKYPKIIEKSNISIKYNFNINIENRGKIILLNWTKKVKERNKTIQEEKNSKIILDSYINFKGLYATGINGFNIGSVEYETKFDAYKKEKKVKGKGIIKSAICGYNIDLESKLNIECRDIEFKNIDINFKHVE